MGKDNSVGAGFNRGLTQEFVAQLNKMYDEGGWWRKFVEDPELFLAIRDNYVNVYYRGCSLVRLTSSRQGVVGEVNYKYLLRREAEGSQYVKVVDGEPRIPDGLFIRRLDQLCDIKAAAEKFAGDEKTGVHEIVLKNPGVVDVEIAFGGETNKRVDLASVRRADGRAILTFSEAKHYSKDLRADPVVAQMKQYDELIAAQKHRIVESYKAVLRNRLNLKGLATQHPERHKCIEGLVDQEIELDPSGVRLIVFGFDGDQKAGRGARLRDRLNAQVKTTFRGVAKELVLRY